MVKRDWNDRRRVGWWVKILSLSAMLTASALGLGKWIYTRASIDDIAILEAKKQDRTEAAKQDRRLDNIQSTVGNVRDNVILLLDRQRIKPVKLQVEPNEIDQQD